MIELDQNYNSINDLTSRDLTLVLLDTLLSLLFSLFYITLHVGITPEFCHLTTVICYQYLWQYNIYFEYHSVLILFQKPFVLLIDNNVFPSSRNNPTQISFQTILYPVGGPRIGSPRAVPYGGSMVLYVTFPRIGNPSTLLFDVDIVPCTPHTVRCEVKRGVNEKRVTR